jgi:hypothetical protein
MPVPPPVMSTVRPEKSKVAGADVDMTMVLLAKFAGLSREGVAAGAEHQQRGRRHERERGPWDGGGPAPLRIRPPPDS